MVRTIIGRAVEIYGIAAAEKLAGPGDREAALRMPIDGLLQNVGQALHRKVVCHDETRDLERGTRPDFAVSINGLVAGFVEVKAPDKSIDPTTFTGHDKEQWNKQRDLPNLIYTNGTAWRLYRDGDLVAEPVSLVGGPLESAGASLRPTDSFEALLTDFLQWHPAPIRSVGALVRAAAPMTRVLRSEVIAQLQLEQQAIDAGSDMYSQPFHGIAADWRRLLFPRASDETFADGYAQAVAFALLLARTQGVDLEAKSLYEVGRELGDEHSLMGRALQLFTDRMPPQVETSVGLLVRLIGAVDWGRIHRGKRDAYLHLYEHFLEVYDPDRRKDSGSYYTPHEIVEEMTRLTEEVLIHRLGKARAFADESVFTVDPAMGTGTFLQTVLERVAQKVADEDGPGAVAASLTEASRRIAGFEIQMGPYAVAELRVADLLTSQGGSLPDDGVQLFVADTLDDPYVAHQELAAFFHDISESRKRANEVKAAQDVTIVIGNPPYHEQAKGRGGWVESGSRASAGKTGTRAIFQDWKDPETARHFHNLNNMWTYFWRWATWKVWESTPNSLGDLPDAGIVCFITPSAYLAGPGYTGMRRYLREWASEGWVIDLTPEGQTPDVASRIFPNVRQPLAIGLFMRAPSASKEIPAEVHYVALNGSRRVKLEALKTLSIRSVAWHEVRTGWTDALTPRPEGGWDSYPALNDLMPWTSPGVTGNRAWPYAPSTSILEQRWSRLQGEPDEATRRELLKETRDRTLEKLPATTLVADAPSVPLVNDRTATPLTPVRVGFRSFDRQWLIPDNRILDRARPDLWEARLPGQLFVVEQHSDPFTGGPGVVVTALLPDLHHFNNRGGRTLPMLHPDGSENVASGLLGVLSEEWAAAVEVNNLVAYVVGVVAHPGFTRTFKDALVTPGVRVPITTSPDLFERACKVGEQVIWAQTYGEACVAPDRPAGSVRFPREDPRQPQQVTPLIEMPQGVNYDADTETLILGDGHFSGVTPAMRAYAVGKRNIIDSWVSYRKADPGGRRSSPLDEIHETRWPSEWSRELIDLLTVLRRLTDLEPEQNEVLSEILAGGTLSMSDLAEAGVAWPMTKRSRSARHATPIDPDTLDIAGIQD